ncbi:hypothetical protein SIN8267_00623 [Sinobacterium norvegicum]|uniref:Peptidase M16C associated domain-containing protein n=1 Tax=Sinobacterium norvegicum TaxID=1641715 RepID=A0ABM9ABF3_9GAMM|nr:insulinase family protein [Sinobacterium norvegicum]CAH0990531.1 hypothetical protein SIN8267_00623 [Sinobacterium norvegicum]
MSSATNASAHSSFEFIRQQRIESLNLTIEHYQHRVTGAVHYHLNAELDENVFLVALRTVPEDSSGVAHILEHTALCGSEKYPVRDPFFMMIRRSLNTFMNAFTSSDWTAYPFASQNKKDFDNLLQVYLDAVFCSRLDELDFAQEGHRVEFSEAGNTDSELEYKGVVFNEMKGAMSSVSSTLWQTLSKYLFPNTTYHFNSGGEPDCIPDLSYQELKDFYHSHYHPSNAIFMTFGNIEAAEHQEKFETLALNKFSALDEQISVGREQRFNAPIKVEDYYALDGDDDTSNKTHLVMAWLWGQNTNLDDLLEGQLLSGLLLDNSASPLRKVLETSEYGSAPSPMCGLEDSNHELTFACGVEGGEAGNSEAFEQLILDTLKDVQKNGIEQQQIDAVLHQLELHQREIGGDGYPYGLQLIMQIISTAAHRGDPISMLDLDPALENLRLKAAQPHYVSDLIQRLLLDNQHRLTLVMKPDTELSERKNAAEKQRLAALKLTLSDDQKNAIVEQTDALNQRQMQVDDESILPKVGLEDVPAIAPAPESTNQGLGELNLTNYSVGTNGLVYQQLIVELPKLTDRENWLLPYYCRCLTELGLGDNDYLESQQRQANVVGSISAFNSMRGKANDEQDVTGYFVLSSKALTRNHREQTQLMYDTFFEVKFTEHNRIRELIAQARGRREQGITGNGHGLAMLAASHKLSPIASLSHKTSGLEGLKSLKALDEAIKDNQALADFANELNQLHEKLKNSPRQLLEVADGDAAGQLSSELASIWQQDNPSAEQPFALAATRQTSHQVWSVNSQVNFCAKAYPTVPVDHVDAAPLTVLGGFLRNGHLHRAIREQGGAYGAGASQESSQAIFRFFSYRDPRTEETLADFDAAVSWLLDNDHEWQKVEEAILGVIGSLDKPGSPAGEAKAHFHNELFGRSSDQRQRFRERILAVKIDDLKRVARQYLMAENESVAIVTNATTAEKLADFIKRENAELIKI